MAKKKTSTKYGGIGSEAVERATGKSWAQWLKVLDADGAADMTHKQIAEHLSEKRGVGPWWSQMVTVGYEQARGRRVKHQVAKGFSVSGSKTVGSPLSKLYACWADKKLRGRWLDGELNVRKATKNKSIRASWGDGTSVEVNFYAKGTGKSMVQVQQAKIATAREATKAKAAWKQRLGEMANLLGGTALRL